MNILITGGAGFIGTNTALYFGQQKSTITIVDNLSRFGTKNNLQSLKKVLGKKLKFICADVNDARAYQKEIKKADAIIHLAGQTAVTTSIKDPQLDFSSNVLGGVTILELVRKHNPNATVLYSSTNKVYGDLTHHNIVLNKKTRKYDNVSKPLGVDETEQLCFISPYGCSKGTIDQYMLDYARTFNLKTVVFRQSCIYGPHQLGVEDQGWVAHFSKQFILDKPITIFGDGYQVRDLLHVSDLISLYDLAIQKIHIVRGSVFNVGGGPKNSYSLHQVLHILEKKIHSKPPVSFTGERLGDQKYFVSDNTRAKKMLGWKPTTSFITGVDSLITWQQKNLR